MRVLLTIFLLFSVMTLSAQGTKETKEYYLNKSKNQKTAGYILAGGGAALIISGTPTIRGFNDLDRRAQDLEALVNRSCLRRLPGLIEALRFRPIRMVH